MNWYVVASGINWFMIFPSGLTSASSISHVSPIRPIPRPPPPPPPKEIPNPLLQIILHDVEVILEKQIPREFLFRFPDFDPNSERFFCIDNTKTLLIYFDEIPTNLKDFAGKVFSCEIDSTLTNVHGDDKFVDIGFACKEILS
jgi:hypothetical protein